MTRNRRSQKNKQKPQWQSFTSYILRPHPGCKVTVYGSPSEKTIAIHDNQDKSVSLTFTPDTCILVEKYINGLQTMLAEIKSI